MLLMFRLDVSAITKRQAQLEKDYKLKQERNLKKIECVENKIKYKKQKRRKNKNKVKKYIKK